MQVILPSGSQFLAAFFIPRQLISLQMGGIHLERSRQPHRKNLLCCLLFHHHLALEPLHCLIHQARHPMLPKYLM